MSLQWTLVATFLYCEIAVIGLLLIPFISAKKWSKFFKSRFLQVLSKQANWYFGLMLVILALLLLDAIREMRKYSSKDPPQNSQLEHELQISMRLFRAQRNFYISGFALFLSLVIQRMTSLISRMALLEAQNEAALKQAQSASAAANTLLKGSGDKKGDSEEVKKLEEDLETATKKITSLEKDKEAVISQAKSLEAEYDRLSEEHRKLQLKVNVQGESKKDD